MQEKQCHMTGGEKSPNAKTEKLKFATYLIFPRTGASKIKSGVFSAKQNAEDRSNVKKCLSLNSF